MGRPTDSPKTTQFSVRFDEETIEILDEYCNQENVSRPEGVRRAVRKLKKQQYNVAADQDKQRSIYNPATNSEVNIK